MALIAIGAFPILRWGYFWFMGAGDGHVQSLIIGAMFVTLGAVSLLIGVLGDLVNFNHKLLEATLERVKRLESGLLAKERGEWAIIRRVFGIAGVNDDVAGRGGE